MLQIRIRDRNQITLPSSIAIAANLRPDDTLNVSCANGVITLVPAKKLGSRRSIMDYVGSAHGTWGKNSFEIDAYLCTERDSWER